MRGTGGAADSRDTVQPGSHRTEGKLRRKGCKAQLGALGSVGQAAGASSGVSYVPGHVRIGR